MTNEKMAEIMGNVGADEEDRVLLKAASLEKIQKVAGSRGQSSGSNRSADAQAWTMGGQVD